MTTQMTSPDSPEKQPEKTDSDLVKAAIEAGAEKLPAEFGTTKDISKALGDGKIKFFPDLPRKEWKELENQRFIIRTIKIVEQFNNRLGTSSFPLLRILCEDGKEYSTLGSGIAVLNICRNLDKNKMLPIRCKLIWQQPEDKGNPYYLLSTAD